MTDIVEQLRAIVIRQTQHGWRQTDAPFLIEAADEIERLRADKAAISETASFYLHEITRLRAGNHEDR